MLKKCKKTDDVLFINASEGYKKVRRQNALEQIHIDAIIENYIDREPREQFSRRVELQEIVEENDYNLNISRYVSTAMPESEIDLKEAHRELIDIEKAVKKATLQHNKFLKELGMAELP